MAPDKPETDRRLNCVLHGSQLTEVMNDLKDIKKMLTGEGSGALGIIGKVHVMWAVFLFIGAGVAIKLGTMIWVMWQS